MKKKKKTQGLNDGYAICYRELKNNDVDFSSKSNSRDDFSNAEEIVTLAYAEENRRDQDYEFAKANDRSLNLKIRTLLREEVTNDDSIVIQGALYNIIKLDYAKSDGVMYFYLEVDRELAESD